MTDAKTLHLAMIAADLLSTKFLIARSHGETETSITIPTKQARILARAGTYGDATNVTLAVEYPRGYTGRQCRVTLRWHKLLGMLDAN